MSAAVIIGASGGIGGALADAIADEGAFDVVHRFARSATGNARLDVTDEASIVAAAAAVAAGPPPTLVIVATGILHGADKGGTGDRKRR